MPPSRTNQRSGYKSVLTQDLGIIADRIRVGDLAQLVSLRDHMQAYLEKVQQCDELIRD